MDRDSAVKQLGAMRAVVGVASWVAPRVSGKTFGLSADDNPSAPYLGRLFGVRDVALAYGAMSATGEDQDRWLTAGLGCDIADAAAGIAAWRGGYLSPVSSFLVTAAAVNAIVLGTIALRGSAAGAGAGPAA